MAKHSSRSSHSHSHKHRSHKRRCSRGMTKRTRRCKHKPGRKVGQFSGPHGGFPHHAEPCLYGERKSGACKRKSGHKRRSSHKRRRCLRGMRKGTRQCRRKPGPK